MALRHHPKVLADGERELGKTKWQPALALSTSHSLPVAVACLHAASRKI